MFILGLSIRPLRPEIVILHAKRFVRPPSSAKCVFCLFGARIHRTHGGAYRSAPHDCRLLTTSYCTLAPVVSGVRVVHLWHERRQTRSPWAENPATTNAHRFMRVAPFRQVTDVWLSSRRSRPLCGHTRWNFRRSVRRKRYASLIHRGHYSAGSVTTFVL